MVKIDNKQYDITLKDSASSALQEALERLKSLGNISAKQLLEEYLKKSIECENLKEEMRVIEGALDTA